MQNRNIVLAALVAAAIVILAFVFVGRNNATGPAVTQESAFTNGMQPILDQVNAPGTPDLASWQQKRAAMICQVIPNLTITNWTGTVTRVDTALTGGAILSIAVMPNVNFGTAPNILNNISNDTLIAQGSPLYQTVAALHIGDKVTFSGQLFSSKNDCIQEASTTLGGSMRTPLFITRFTTITPAPNGS